MKKALPMTWTKKTDAERQIELNERLRPRTKKDIAHTKKCEKIIQQYFK